MLTQSTRNDQSVTRIYLLSQSLKKEVDWDRTEERSASSEMSTDYRLPPDPVSLNFSLHSKSKETFFF